LVALLKSDYARSEPMVQSTDMFPATEAAKSDPIPATDRRTMSAVGMSSRNVPDEQPGESFGELIVEVGRAEGRVVVRLRGDLDVHSAPRLRRTLADLIEGQGNLVVVVDLAGLDFLDAVGLGVLVRAGRDLQSRGGEIVFRAPSRAICRVFHITGLDNSFTITGVAGSYNSMIG
jgi:anti-sigma B factor antagonist